MEDAIGLFIISIVFFLLAIALSFGKGAFLIAGYNTMPDSERAKYDELALCKFMSKLMYGITLCLLLMGIGEVVDSELIFILATAIMIISVVFVIIFLNTGNRFKKER